RPRGCRAGRKNSSVAVFLIEIRRAVSSLGPEPPRKSPEASGTGFTLQHLGALVDGGIIPDVWLDRKRRMNRDRGRPCRRALQHCRQQAAFFIRDREPWLRHAPGR